MQLRGVWRDEGAVSPVIGVILMVAITVVLGSVIGTFTLGLGDRVGSAAPQAQLEFTFNETATGADCDGGSLGSGEGALTVAHGSGDELSTGEVRVTGSDVAAGNVAFDEGCTGLPAEMTAGASFSTAVERDDEVRVVWVGDERSTVLGTWSDA